MAFYRAHILVDTGTPAVLKGAMAVKTALVDEIRARGLDKEIKVVETGDLGIHNGGPGIVVYPEGVTYAILLMNILTPLIDRLTSRRVYGTVKQHA